MKGNAVARTLSPAPPADAVDGAVDALRRRLAESTAREHVVLDFLEDDLRESRAALSAVAAFLANVEAALSDEAPTPERLMSLARAVDPAAQVDYLQTVLASVRRRLSQVAARM
ncbi:MAG TPA: hypothetical protein VMU15_04940 [Anaeromyxobacter sp.]|nr:hypothetical protein [Anaeromyxobacter sp.]